MSLFSDSVSTFQRSYNDYFDVHIKMENLYFKLLFTTTTKYRALKIELKFHLQFLQLLHKVLHELLLLAVRFFEVDIQLVQFTGRIDHSVNDRND